MVGLLTTNFTSFFRDIAHFDFQNRFLALCPARINARILATDLSTRILEKRTHVRWTCCDGLVSGMLRNAAGLCGSSQTTALLRTPGAHESSIQE